MGNWFWLKSYTKQPQGKESTMQKKNRTQFESKIKKAIQKVNWEDKLETPCI